MSTSPDATGAASSNRLATPKYFARVTVDPEAGTMVRPDGLDMAPEPLFAEARRHLVGDARAAS
jgi:hypothetical protein